MIPPVGVWPSTAKAPRRRGRLSSCSCPSKARAGPFVPYRSPAGATCCLTATSD